MKKAVLITLTSVIIVVVLIILACIIYFNYVTRDTRLDLDKLEHVKSTTILANDNSILNSDNYVPYKEIPQLLIDSFLSIEDRRFMSHNGIDIKRIIGALTYNISHGKRAQGASTITQQLIKNTYLTNKKTFDRKFKEIKLALLLEKELSKEEILERYMNTLYFGNGIYGIRDASRQIFGKELSELDLSECATIAGIVKAPAHYSPLSNISKSRDRRDIVLGAMLDNNKIDKNSYTKAINEDIILNNKLIHSKLSAFYIKQALNEASNILGLSVAELMSSSFEVATFYDEYAEKILYDSLSSIDEDNKNIDKLVMLADNHTAGIQACYANISDNIMNYRRQVGSTMKPLAVYLPALEYGIIAPASIYNDEKLTINGYTPHNYNDHYRGKISIRNAIMHSSNVIAVEVLAQLTINKSKNFLEKMGIDIVDNGLSIALGGLNTGLTPIELIGGYMAIANSGSYSKPTFIKYIRDDKGKIIYRYNKLNKKICHENSAYLMTDMLRSTALYGTAKKLSSLPFDIASKTGTVSDGNDKNTNTDAYNMSYNTENTLLVWMGNQLPKNIQGGGLPTIVARNIYDNLYSINPKPFNKPNGIKDICFDKDLYDTNGEIIINNNSLTSYNELFDERYMPTKHIVTIESISYNYTDEKLDIIGIEDADIKIYKSDLFGNSSIYTEILGADNEEVIPLRTNIFNCYVVEIYYNGDLVKSIKIE